MSIKEKRGGGSVPMLMWGYPKEKRGGGSVPMLMWGYPKGSDYIDD